MQPLLDGGPVGNAGTMVLREIAYLRFMPPLHFTRIETDIGIGNARSVCEQRLQQRRFARSVPAHQRDLLAALDGRAKALDHFETVITLHHALEFQRMPSGRTLLLEADVGALYVRAREFLRLQTLHFLLTRRHLARASTGRKARDKFV